MDLALYQQAGSQPVPGVLPQGADVRDDPRFEALQQILAPLSSPQANMQVDWDRVAQLAAALLVEAGKDLLVGSYLAGALFQQGGLRGLAEGLGVMADMVERYWPTMYPPVARIRGRRNAVQWLLERVDRVAQEQRWESLAPQPSDLVALLHMEAERLEQALALHDPDGPSLHGLLSSLSRIPMESQEGAETVPPTGSPPVVLLSTPCAATVASVAGEIGLPVDCAALDVSVVATQDHLFRVADALLAADPTDARAYRLNRVAAWMDFVQLPPDDNGRTRIAAPLQEVVESAIRLRDGGLDLEMLLFAEAQLPAFPCWLDLQCWVATAMERLGEPYAAARQAVQAATRAWLSEFPGLVREQFENGMPFASEASVRWLTQLGRISEAANADTDDVASSMPPGSSAPSASSATLAQARAMAGNGELDDAIALVQSAITDAHCAAERLRARIALCELLAAYRPGPVWRPLARATVDEIDHHDLEVWEPSLALAGWKAAYAVFRHGDDGDEEPARLLARIARIDASLALRLLNLP